MDGPPVLDRRISRGGARVDLVTATIHERDPTALDVCAGVFVREFSRRTGAIRYGAIRLRM